MDNIPEIKAGDDLSRIICERVELEDDDIITIASTIVSKAEDRKISIESITPSEKAIEIAAKNDEDPRLVEAILQESKTILIEAPFILTENRWKNICVSAGIDRSNIEPGYLLLPPKDPDVSAKNIRGMIYDLSGKHVSVIITDTCGRAFRVGQTGVAIGCSGITPNRDWRGEQDLYGNTLEITNEAVIDELAGTANLLMGEGEQGTPVVVIRGVEMNSEHEGITDIYRPDKDDVIKKALSEAMSRNK